MSCRGGQGLCQFFLPLGKDQKGEKRRPFPQAKEPPFNLLFRSNGKDGSKGKSAIYPFKRPEMVDKEPGSFYLSVNLQAYRTQSFAFLPEIQGNQKERVDSLKPQVLRIFLKERKN
jgi:hypothetical protein